YPDIFPNYYSIPANLDRRYVKEVLDFATYMATWFRWLPVALIQDSGDFLAVFDRWQEWRAKRKATAAESELGWTPYFSDRLFRNEFLEFVKTCYLPEMAKAKPAIEALVETEGLPLHELRRLADCPTANPLPEDMDWVPRLSEDMFVLDLAVDYQELIASLRSKSGLNSVGRREVTIVLKRVDRKIDVVQLSPQSVALLRLCDGRRTIPEIAREFTLTKHGLDGIPVAQTCLFGLMKLQTDGFVALLSKAAAAARLAADEEVNGD